jgi:hypothetical protein
MSEKRQRGYVWRHQHSGKSLRTVAGDLGISTERVRELYDTEIARRLHEGKEPF